MSSRLDRLVIATDGIDELALKPLSEHVDIRIRPFQAEKDRREAAYDVVLTTNHDMREVHPHLPVLIISPNLDAAYLKDELLPEIERALTLDFDYPLDIKNSQVAMVATGSGKPLGEMMQFIVPNLGSILELIEEAFHAEAWDELAEQIHAVRPSVKMLGAHRLAEVLQTMELKMKQHNVVWVRINGQGMIQAVKELITTVRDYEAE